MKWLAIFALLLLIFPMQAHAQTNKTEKTYQRNEPALATSDIGVQQHGGPKLQSEPKGNIKADVRVVSTPAKDGYDKAAVWINFFLAVIGVFGIGVAVGTLMKIERQTKATELAAEATLSNANALINAERGKLVVVCSTPDPDSSEAGMFEFKIRNIGRCPVLLTFARLRILFLSRGYELPKEPQGLEESDQPYLEEWVLPGDSTPLLVVDALEVLDLSGSGLLAPAEKIDGVRDGELQAWVYGRMRYFDGVTPLETTSGFCYYALCDEDGPKWLLRGGPAAYWKETSQRPQKAN